MYRNLLQVSINSRVKIPITSLQPITSCESRNTVTCMRESDKTETRIPNEVARNWYVSSTCITILLTS